MPGSLARIALCATVAAAISLSIPAAFSLPIPAPALPVSPDAELAEVLTAEHSKLLDDRRQALTTLGDLVHRPLRAVQVVEFSPFISPDSTWKRQIVATVFWVGEQPTENNPTPNDKSAWDTNWQANFGGVDDPVNREGFLPKGFIPNLNPFYCALPYNDLMPGGHRPEASQVIPWFSRDYKGPVTSVCRGRWLAIHYRGKTCYASWQDVGPFEVDHWQYVFGNERPRYNRNLSAGLDISPAVRDFLGISGGRGLVDWKFVEARDVPHGPWANWKTPAQPHNVQAP